MNSAYRVVWLFCLIALAVGASPLELMSGDHPLTKIENNATAKKDTIDLTVTLDWDVLNPPAGRGKDFVSNVMKQFARSLYTMTEGRLQLGRIYVYGKNKFQRNTDVNFYDCVGHADANMNGLLNGSGQHIAIYTTYKRSSGETKTETPEGIGKTLGHELGHYGLGLFDEYGVSDPPQTIMDDHEQYITLSTPDLYSGFPGRTKTDQYQMYGMSAWEILPLDPKKDPKAVDGYPTRNYYPSMKGVVQSDSTKLTRPVTGYDSALKVFYMDEGTVMSVIVINRNVDTASLSAQKKGAARFIDAAPDTTRVAVLAYPGSVDTPVYDWTWVASSRANIKAAIDKLTPNSSFSGDDNAKAEALGIALDKAYSMIVQTRGDKDTPLAVLFSDSSLPVKASQADKFKSAGIPVSVLAVGKNAKASGRLSGNAFIAAKKTLARNAIKSAAESANDSTTLISLSLLSSLTGGRFTLKPKGVEAGLGGETLGVKTLGGDRETLYDESVDGMTPNSDFVITTRVGSSGLDADVEFCAEWESPEDNGVSYSLTAPDGTVITPAALPAGITYDYSATECYACYRISSAYTGQSGIWSGRVRTSSPTAKSVFQEVTSQSALSVSVNVSGGTTEEPKPALVLASIRGTRPVAKAWATAAILKENGDEVASGIRLKDDGVYPDMKANDGIYTASIQDSIVVGGNYIIQVEAGSDDGKAVYTSTGATANGVSVPDDVPTGNFSRTDEVYFSSDWAPESSSGGGGGCSIGGDGSDMLSWIACILAMSALLRGRCRKKAK